MKKRIAILVGILMVAIATLGFGCGGGSATTVGSSTDPGVIDPSPDPTPDPGADPGDGGDDGGVIADLDQDGIPDSEDDDADGDGFLNNGDDCDDMNAEIFPGALDKPDYPNYTDSNCDNVDGDLDDAFWVSLDGNDANPGTIDQPFLTLQHAIDQAKADLADIKDVYVVEGVYNENAVLSEGVGFYGGYGPLSATGSRDRDIDAHLTEHHGLNTAFWASATTSGVESIIEGMTFVALVDSPAIIVFNSSPTIRHNKIYGIDSPNWSLGAYSIAFGNASYQPVFYDNLIESRDTDKPGSVSAGILISGAGNNTVLGTVLESNDIRSGVAVHASIGVYMLSSGTALTSLAAFKNDIQAEASPNLTAGIMMGYDIFNEQATQFTGAEIYKNRIYGGHDATSSYGIIATDATGVVLLRNNFITGGHDAAFQSGGIYVNEAEAHILNNSINAGSGGVGTTCVHLGANAATRIDNNILYSESGLNTIRNGVLEMQATSTPSSLRNNLFDESLDILYVDFAIGNILNVAAINILPDIALIGDNISGAALFADVASYDYHLLEDSDAIDAGFDLTTEVSSDIDDEAREEGLYDIGADEFMAE